MSLLRLTDFNITQNNIFFSFYSFARGRVGVGVGGYIRIRIYPLCYFKILRIFSSGVGAVVRNVYGNRKNGGSSPIMRDFQNWIFL